MERVAFFKNAYMVTEIDIAGTFIYRGIREFNSLDSFYNAGEIFHVLYPLSVGIERLQKVLLVLLEEIRPEQAHEFEKRLITHSHRELHDRIVEKLGIKLNQHENRFLDMLAHFYNTCRYNRFNFTGDLYQERTSLVTFLEESLKITIDNDSIFVTPNNDRIKRFWGRIVGSISRAYYKEIAEVAGGLGLFSYELRSDSAAYKVFMPSFADESLQRQYENEQVAFKELVIYLMNSKHSNSLLSFMRDIPPINLDVALIQEHLSGMLKYDISQSLIDEVASLYEEEVEDISSRIELLKVIGNDRVVFPEEPEEDDKWDIGHDH